MRARLCKFLCAGILCTISFTSLSRAEEVMMATMSPTGSPSRFVYDQLLSMIEDKTDGAYTIKPFFNGELGPEESYFQAMRRGRIQLSAVSGQAIGTAVPEFAILRAPFLFDSFEELAFIYDEFLLDLLAELFSKKDMIHLQWAANGWENIYGQKPILRPVDVDGYRIRVPLEPNAALFFGAANADVIQIPFTDIIPSLQTGLIDGGESTALMYVQAGLYSEAPHFTETKHGFSLAVYAANKDWYNHLSADVQKAFKDIYLAPDKAFPILRRQTNTLLLSVAEQGDLEIHSLSDEERGLWQRSTARAVEQIINQAGGRSTELYDLILAGKQAFQNTRGGSASK